MSEKNHVVGKWEISIEPEPWDAYFYNGWEHGDTRAPMGIQEGLKYFNGLEVQANALQQQLAGLKAVADDLAHSVRTQHHKHQTKDEWVVACGFLPPNLSRIWREPIEWCRDCQLLARYDALISPSPIAPEEAQE